jgi:hypothetical protein
MSDSPKYRAHICIEFTTDEPFPEAIADDLVRRIVDHVGFPHPIDSIWLDDVTEQFPKEEDS